MNTAENSKQMRGTQLDPVQIKMLRSLRNGSLLPQLLRTYRDQAGNQLTGIKTAATCGDAATVMTIAHTLKSASFSIGARQIGELCAALEAAGRAGEIPDTESLCAELDQLFASLLPEIETYL